MKIRESAGQKLPLGRGIHFKFMMMSFSLANTLASFMDIMNRVLRPFLDPFIVVFIDGILVYSKDIEVHKNHLRLGIGKTKETPVVCQTQ